MTNWQPATRLIAWRRWAATTTNKLGELLHHLSARLTGISETATLDAQVLTAHIMRHPRTWVIAHPEVEVPAPELEYILAATKRLEEGEPLPYILGEWEFYGLRFAVSPAVLIPRPETELLVEAGLDWLHSQAGRRVVDVGTGSGCIAISMAVNFPAARLLAVDLSWEALQVARRNAAALGAAERVIFLQSDLLCACAGGQAGAFDLICANLPYVPLSELHGLRVARWEPHLAVFGGEDGLELIRRLLEQARILLAPGGRLLLEIEARQGEAVRQLAREALPQARVEVRVDLAGHERLVVVDKV